MWSAPSFPPTLGPHNISPGRHFLHLTTPSPAHYCKPLAHHTHAHTANPSLSPPTHHPTTHHQPQQQVQWFERRGSLPASVSASMHEAEVVESDLVDTNLVGCLDSKALIITADTYEEVRAGRGVCLWLWSAGRVSSWLPLQAILASSFPGPFGLHCNCNSQSQHHLCCADAYVVSCRAVHAVLCHAVLRHVLCRRVSWCPRATQGSGTFAVVHGTVRASASRAMLTLVCMMSGCVHACSWLWAHGNALMLVFERHMVCSTC